MYMAVFLCSYWRGFTAYCPAIGYYTQIGLAVGDTEQERQKAEFTKLKAWVSIRKTHYHEISLHNYKVYGATK